jgi:hypothetical protein
MLEWFMYTHVVDTQLNIIYQQDEPCPHCSFPVQETLNYTFQTVGLGIIAGYYATGFIFMGIHQGLSVCYPCA